MNILVTGGSGYIGSIVARELAEAGHRIWILDDIISTAWLWHRKNRA